MLNLEIAYTAPIFLSLTNMLRLLLSDVTSQQQLQDISYIWQNLLVILDASRHTDHEPDVKTAQHMLAVGI